jgi:hypothetical protein
MSQPEVIHSFLKGQIGPWAFFRKLVRAGVSVGAALTLTMGLPAVARGEKTADQFLEEVRETSPNDFEEIERLLTMVSKAIGTAVENGNLHPLAVAVAKVGVSLNVPLNEPARLKLEGNVGGVPVNLGGSLLNFGEKEDFRNMSLVLGGTVGELSVNLAGNVDAPLGNDNGNGQNVSLGNARLNVVGTAGNVPLTFRGQIGRLVVPPPTGEEGR